MPHPRRGSTTSSSHSPAATTEQDSFESTLVFTATPETELIPLSDLPVKGLITTMGRTEFLWSAAAKSDEWKIVWRDVSGDEFLGVNKLDWENATDATFKTSLVRLVSKSAWDKGLRSTSGGDAADLTETSRTIIRTLCVPQGKKQAMWLKPDDDDGLKKLAVSLLCTIWNKNTNAAKGTCKIKLEGGTPTS